MDAHDLVCRLRELALELGRTPTRAEFISIVSGAENSLRKHFKSYNPLLTAAGLETHKEKTASQKIDHSIFNRSIDEHLKEFEPEQDTPFTPPPSFAIISDIHWPFENKRVIDKFMTYVEKERPTWVIINGDAWDMYCHGKYPRSHNVFTPRDEERLARERNDAFWKRIKKLHKDAKCVQLMGNHDIRPMKRVLEAYPAAEDWIAQRLKELFTFPGVETIHNSLQELYLDKETIVFHGYSTKLGQHRDETLMNTCVGHSHVGGVVFRKIRNRTLFEGNSGMAGDPYSKGLTYRSQKLVKWTPGFLVCDEWGPRFIPA